jgi:hypothetical protein
VKPYETMTPEEKKEQARLDLIGVTVGGIFSCAKSLLAQENLKGVTVDDYVKLEKIYHDLHVIQQRVACGYDIEAEEARTVERLAKHFGLKP